MTYMRNVLRWAKTRLFLTAKRDNSISYGLIFIFWFVSSVSAYIHAIGNPTGASFLSHIGNAGKMIGLNTLAFILATVVLGIIFSFLYIPLPRLFLGSFVYAISVNIGILVADSAGKKFSIIIGSAYSLAVLFIGILFVFLVRGKRGRIILASIVGIIILIGGSLSLIDNFGSQDQTLEVFKEYTDQEENPDEEGDYDYSFFTYGSGEDIQREEFGEAVDELTPSIDASDWITRWKDDKKEFWGYDASNLPVNGRVWMPEGDGPFPILLMVHGNHSMEEFSTDGYDYLGEHLASRGFIAISVDEDFINFSNVSGSPNDNYELRAWMIMQHIRELQNMNQSSESNFYHKIDFDEVALMGHSRGGQAVLMAADYMTFFEDDPLTENMDDINIKGVVSIAPTDKTIDGNKPHINNISYLFLGGGMDADVSDFRGDRQYYRTTFDPSNDGFKSTLYLADANHTQFNTSWGRSDLSMPRGLFLNYRTLMSGNSQQQIAKVYMSAFMEAVFNKKTGYKELFKDYQYGSDWLPDTQYVNKYQDAAYTPVVEFVQDDSDSIASDGFKSGDIITPEDRAGNDRLSDALQLEWDSEASYSIDLLNEDFRTNVGELPEELVLTMANVDAEADEGQTPEVGVLLETKDGNTVEVPLDDYAPFASVMSTDYTAFGLFEGMFRDGKYEPSWEPVFQTFTIPMEAFEESDGSFNKSDISKLTLHFTSDRGKVLVEEIGVQ